jgi:hypothetical protein
VVRNLTQVRVTPTGQAVGMSILWRLEIHGADFASPRTGRQLTPTDLPGGEPHPNDGTSGGNYQNAHRRNTYASVCYGRNSLAVCN